jgi:hypothetical protein
MIFRNMSTASTAKGSLPSTAEVLISAGVCKREASEVREENVNMHQNVVQRNKKREAGKQISPLEAAPALPA